MDACLEEFSAPLSDGLWGLLSPLDCVLRSNEPVCTCLDSVDAFVDSSGSVDDVNSDFVPVQMCSTSFFSYFWKEILEDVFPSWFWHKVLALGECGQGFCEPW